MTGKKKKKRLLLLFLLVSLLIAILAAPLASSLPDGLERVAIDKGFIQAGEKAPAMKAPFSDYTVAFISNPKVSTAAAGLLGTLLVFASVVLAASLLRKRGPGPGKADE